MPFREQQKRLLYNSTKTAVHGTWQ